MKNQAVVTFDGETIFELKRIVLDRDRDGAITFLRKLERRIDEAMRPKMKGPV
jgi:hypothetical protein